MKVKIRKLLAFLFLSLSLAGIGLFLSPYLVLKIAQKKNQGFAPLLSKEAEVSGFAQIIKESKNQPPLVLGAQASPEPEIRNFLLTIDKIGLQSAVVIPEVDANNSQSYKQALKMGLVHAKGSAVPGEGKMVYIFGHSTNYAWFVQEINALLYQIEKVELGDKIKIEYNGEHFLYHIFDKQIVKTNDLHLLKEITNEDILVIQSCYPPGTTLKRLLLFARPSKMGALIY